MHHLAGGVLRADRVRHLRSEGRVHLKPEAHERGGDAPVGHLQAASHAVGDLHHLRVLLHGHLPVRGHWQELLRAEVRVRRRRGLAVHLDLPVLVGGCEPRDRRRRGRGGPQHAVADPGEHVLHLDPPGVHPDEDPRGGDDGRDGRVLLVPCVRPVAVGAVGGAGERGGLLVRRDDRAAEHRAGNLPADHGRDPGHVHAGDGSGKRDKREPHGERVDVRLVGVRLPHAAGQRVGERVVVVVERCAAGAWSTTRRGPVHGVRRRVAAGPRSSR